VIKCGGRLRFGNGWPRSEGVKGTKVGFPSEMALTARSLTLSLLGVAGFWGVEESSIGGLGKVWPMKSWRPAAGGP